MKIVIVEAEVPMSFLSGFKKVIGAVGKFAAKGVNLLPYVMQAVVTTEQVASGQLSGQAKQNLAIGLIKDYLAIAEAGAGKDLLDDAEVEAAARAVIDAVVAFQNLIAKKSQSAS